MNQDERQVSFSAGELAPGLHGRTDLDRYVHGAACLRNWVVTPFGTLMNRAGLQHIATLSVSGLTEGAIIVPFVFGPDDNYILVFRHANIEWYKPNPSDPRHSWTSAFAVGSPYTVAHLPTLRFAQLGNVITIVSEHYAPRELRRNDNGSWSLTLLDFDIPDAPDLPDWSLNEPEIDEGTYTDTFDGGSGGEQAVPATDEDHNFPHLIIDNEDGRNFVGVGVVQSGEFSNIRNTHTFQHFLKGYTFTGGSVAADPDTWWDIDPTHPPRPWSWLMTYFIERSDGSVYESLGVPVTQGFFLGETITGDDGTLPAGAAHSMDARGPFTIPSKTAVYADMVRTFAVGVLIGTEVAEGTIISARLYRGREGRFGLVGETTSYLIDDDGTVPDFGQPPPQGINPFEDNNPTQVTFYEGRRYFATAGRIYGSATEEYTNFDEIIPASDADALSFSLASDQNEEMRGLVPGDKGLLALTTVSEWPLTGSGQANNLITPNSLPVTKPASAEGCAEVAPVRIDKSVFFVQADGALPKMIVSEGGDFEVVDISLLSRHLFEGYTIISWAYAKHPHSVLWVVRSDGRILSFTFMRKQNMLAWAWHDAAGGGLAEWVACKPEGGETGVYFVMNYDGTRYLERLAYRTYPLTPDSEPRHETPDIRFAIFLDRCKSTSGLVDVAGLYIKLVDAGSGGEVGVTVKAYFPEFTVFTVDTYIQIDNPAGGASVRILLLFATQGTDDGEYTYDAVVQPSTDVPDNLFGVQVQPWWTLFSVITGLSHLDGETVTVVADGEVVGEVEVVGGSAEIGGMAAIAHAGLGYVSEFESLGAVQERGKKKIIEEVELEFEHTRGGEVGESLDETMQDVPLRDVEFNYLPVPPVTVKEAVRIETEWNVGGAVALRQSDPMPMTILGITRRFRYGESQNG